VLAFQLVPKEGLLAKVAKESTKNVTEAQRSLLKERNTMKPARPTATPRQTPTHVPKSTPDLQEQIRRRAYELYEQRGRDDGHQLEDWLRAESEVTQKKAKIVAAQRSACESAKPTRSGHPPILGGARHGGSVHPQAQSDQFPIASVLVRARGGIPQARSSIEAVMSAD
jgi:DUF2934 family protein